MKKIVRKIVTYQCSVCGEEYRNKSEARACESIPIQKSEYKVGNMVWPTEVRHCCDQPYYPQMKVVKIIGPIKSDHSELGGHLFVYHARYQCPRCKTNHENEFWPSDICGEPREGCIALCKKYELEVR